MPFPLTFPYPGDVGPHSPEGYARQLKQLLPRGSLWLLEQGSELSKFLVAIADEFSRVDARGVNLIDESDPRTATETLDDWESALSLPDERVTEISTDPAERRLAVTQKYTNRGGQSPSFFVAFAAECGYTVTISNFHTSVARCGAARCGEARTESKRMLFKMLVTVTAIASTALPVETFERVITHAVHSHATVTFAYP